MANRVISNGYLWFIIATLNFCLDNRATIFERGLINHIAHFDDYNEQSILELSKRFASLGIEAVLLMISDNLLETRIRLRDEQMKISNTGISYQEQVQQAKRQQDNMLNVLKKIDLPSRIICTDSMNWDEYAKFIVCN